MILIITTDYERAVSNVCKWLSFYNMPFLRLTLNEFIEAFDYADFEQDEMSFNHKELCFSVKNIKALWIRKVKFDFLDYASNVEISKYNKDDVMRFLYNEIDTLINYIFSKFEKTIPILGAFYPSGFNKLQALEIAKISGFKIPNTRVLTMIEYNQLSGYITKPISEIFSTLSKTYRFASYTSVINWGNNNNSKYFPSLSQDNISKKSELRVFVIGLCIYAVSITIKNEKGNTDWRNVKNKNNIIYAPYTLPKGTRLMIKNIMKKLKIDIAAFDFIEDLNGEIYFIEINPDGSFEMIQDTLETNIDKKIAEFLIKRTKNKNDEKNNEKKFTDIIQ